MQQSLIFEAWYFNFLIFIADEDIENIVLVLRENAKSELDSILRKAGVSNHIDLYGSAAATTFSTLLLLIALLAAVLVWRC